MRPVSDCDCAVSDCGGSLSLPIQKCCAFTGALLLLLLLPTPAALPALPALPLPAIPAGCD